MMGMVTSPAGTQARQRYLMLFLLWSLTMMMCFRGPRALSWSSMAVRMINFHSNLNLCGICCSSLMVCGAWWASSKSWLISLWDLSQWFLNSLGNLERFQLSGSWQTLFWFSRRTSWVSLETKGLSVSLQWLVKLWRRLFWDVLKDTWRITQPAQVHMVEFLLHKFNFLLWQGYPPS